MPALKFARLTLILFDHTTTRCPIALSGLSGCVPLLWLAISDHGHDLCRGHGRGPDRCGDAGHDPHPGHRRDRDGVCTTHDVIPDHGDLYRDRGPDLYLGPDRDLCPNPGD